MTSIVFIIGTVLSILGIIGCIIPALPGPPFNFIALLLLLIIDPDLFSLEFIIIIGALNVIILLLDYVLPVIGAKIYGATKYGIWGSIIGLLLGLIFFPPFGMILGLFFGTIIGELIGGKKGSGVLKAGLASFVISIFMIVLKVSFSIYMTYHYFTKSIELLW